MSPRRFARWAPALLVTLTAGACAPNTVRVIGQISFADDAVCQSPVDSQVMSWPDCHAFKRHYDPMTGAPIIADAAVPGELRPLPATIEFTYLARDTGGPGVRVCSQGTFQANEDGVFNVPLGGCGAGTPGTIVGRVFLQAPVHFGDVRSLVLGLWREDDSYSLLEDIPGLEVGEQRALVDSDGLGYAIPTLTFRYEVASEPVTSRTMPAIINVGNQTFLTRSDIARYDYVRMAVSAFASVVELHRRAHAEWGGGLTPYTNAMFRSDPGIGSLRYYVVSYTDEWAMGRFSQIWLYRPDVELLERDLDGDGVGDGAESIEWLVSDTDTLAHEFGHTLHAGFAAASGGPRHYAFASAMTASDGTAYGGDKHWGSQYQEMGVAFSEGIASTLGAYLLHRCRGFDPTVRPLGGVNPFSGNQWSGNQSCDGTTQNNCGFHAVRNHLVTRRGLVPGSDEFNARVARLQALTAAAGAQRFVTSSNEMRYGEFGCDLLDVDGDVSHATGRVEGMVYSSDFVYQVGEILDGSTEPPALSRYPNTPPVAEDVTISFAALLDAMASFCPDGCVVPDAYGHEYNLDRLRAIGGRLSPQTLGVYLFRAGLLSMDQLDNLLRTNFMDSFVSGP